MQCQNNCKQLGLACHTYHDTFGEMPAGTAVESADTPEARLSLFVSLLPYLEQEALVRDLNPCQGWEHKENVAAASKICKALLCPSYPSQDGSRAITNYVGVAGLGADAATLGIKDRRRGFFGYEEATRFEDVKDGTSNTLLFIETSRDLGPWVAGGLGTVRGVEPAAAPLVGKDGAFGNLHSATRWNFGRVHGKANAVLGDGSARHIRDDIHPDVLAGLATIAGDEKIPDW